MKNKFLEMPRIYLWIFGILAIGLAAIGITEFGVMSEAVLMGASPFIFVLKSGAQVQHDTDISLIPEDEKASFLTARKSFDDAAAKEELSGLKSKIAELESKITTTGNTAEITALKSQLTEATNRMENLDAMILEMKKGAAVESEKSVKKGLVRRVNSAINNLIRKINDNNFGHIEGMKAVSVTSDYTDAPTQYVPNIREDFPMQTSSITDLFSQTNDVKQNTITVPVVESWTESYDEVGENDSATEVSFKFKEESFDMKRISKYLDLSNRYLSLGLGYVVNWLMTRMPAALMNLADFYIINKIKSAALTISDFADVTITAGDIASQTDASGFTKLTFGAAHGIKMSGGLITWSAVPGGTDTVVAVVSATELIIDRVFSPGASATWAGTYTNALKDEFIATDEYGVLTGLASIQESNEYSTTGIIVNPMDIVKLKVLKSATDEHYIGGGYNVLVPNLIGGIPYATSKKIPKGSFIIGDTQKAATIHWLKAPTMTQSIDTIARKKNQVTYIGDLEMIFELSNPYWFIYGKFSDWKSYFGA